MAFAIGLSLQTSPAIADQRSSTDTEAPPVTASDRETARKLMDRGKRSFERADYVDALASFVGADKIMRLPVTGLWVGKTLVRLSRLTEARDKLYRTSRLPAADNENEVLAQAREEAEVLHHEVAMRVPEVVLRFDGWDGKSRLEVRIDGDVISTDLALLPRGLDPGPHRLVVRSTRHETLTLDFSLTEGESKRLRVVLNQGMGALSDGQGENPNVSRSHAAKRGPSTWVWVGGGLAVAGLVTGSITGGLAMSRSSCGETPGLCDGGPDPVLGTVSAVSFGLGGAGAIIGLVAALAGGDKSGTLESARSGLQLAPGTNSAGFGFTATW
ncbi:MAG: hypothetical protein AAF715_21165 [Myxococcota bacterium]